MAEQKKYIAFLRGINVGGRHKVDMAELKKVLEDSGYTHVKTLLNSGNVIFIVPNKEIQILEQNISDKLEKHFGFKIPVLIRDEESIQELIKSDPFQGIQFTKDLRFYITFIRQNLDEPFKVPWTSSDNSYQIINILDKTVVSILDVSKSKTTDAMNILEKTFGKDITTRNWNTIEKINNLLVK